MLNVCFSRSVVLLLLWAMKLYELARSKTLQQRCVVSSHPELADPPCAHIGAPTCGHLTRTQVLPARLAMFCFRWCPASQRKSLTLHKSLAPQTSLAPHESVAPGESLAPLRLMVTPAFIQQALPCSRFTLSCSRLFLHLTWVLILHIHGSSLPLPLPLHLSLRA